MSKQYNDELKGVLFRNDEKREGKKDADYRGKIQIGGKVYWLDAWINTSKDGAKYMALTATPKDGPPARTESKAKTPSDDFDDDIPF